MGRHCPEEMASDHGGCRRAEIRPGLSSLDPSKWMKRGQDKTLYSFFEVLTEFGKEI